uniref:Serpentine Receptor, class T n=1 Tax=Rhabditophanes sp. KR3021 TaxID=114890 RepID=A0AC35U4C5_9BILA
MNVIFESNNFDPEIISKYYNCSYLTQEQWARERNPNLILGLFYLFLGIPFQIMYLPALWVITRREFFKLPVYKILTFLGIVDFLSSIVCTEVTGVYTIIGAVYCSDYPAVNYYSGILGMAGWTASCLTNMILIITRVIDMYKPSLSETLFDGYKTYIWLFFPLVYFIYVAIYTRHILYSSKVTSWMYDPFYGTTQVKFPETDYYHNHVHTFNNISAVVILSPLYLFLFKLFFTKVSGIGGKTQSMDKVKKAMLIQSSVICTLNFMSAFTYIIIENVPLGIWATILAQLAWQSSHLIMSFVLCFLNPSIKKYILTHMLPCLGYAPTKTSPTAMVTTRITIVKSGKVV